jgi:hypothetical protein
LNTVQVASDILGSQEAYTDQVTNLYVTYLRRAADPGGLQNHVNTLLSGARRNYFTFFKLAARR